MKKQCLLLIILACAAGFSCFEPATAIDARNFALGRSLVALADDPAAVFINPAGIAFQNRPGLTNMYSYSTPTEKARQIDFSAVLPELWGGGVGIGFEDITFFQTMVSSETVDQFNRQLLLSYAKRFSSNLSLGANLKLFFLGLSKDIYPSANGNGQSVDLALKYEYNPNLSLGINLQSILPESMGGKITRGDGSTDKIPSNYQFGLSYLPWQNLSLNLEVDKASSDPTTLHLGAEWWINKLMALRSGIDQSTSNNQIYTNLCLGFGLNFSGVNLDYAYFQRGDPTKKIDQYFSFSYIWPAEQKKPAETKTPPASTVVAVKLKHFNDVPQSYWAQDAIERLATLGIISGYPDNTFRPDSSITRAELASLLVKSRSATDVSLGSIVPFNDVPTKYWAAPYIGEAVKQGILNGYPGETFRPGNNVSRAEGITVLARYAKLPQAIVLEAPYEDVSGRHWAVVYITAAKQAGLLKYLYNKFEPDRNITRAEVAFILFQTNFMQQQLAKYRFE